MNDAPEAEPAAPSGVSRRTALIGAGATLTLMALGRQAFSATAASAATGPWGGYDNGQIPLSALSPVVYPGVSPDPFTGSLAQVYLEPHAAIALLAMLQAYHTQTGDYLPVVEGYRTLEGQQYWKDYWTARGKPGNAATPGTSNHGWGEAVDFDQNHIAGSRLTWIRANCETFGYSIYDAENWHFNYTGSYAGTPPPRPPQQEEEDMRAVLRQKTGVVYVIGQQFVKRSFDKPSSDIAGYVWGDAVGLNEPDFYRTLSLSGIPFSEFGKADADYKGGWSIERGVFTEEPFPAV